MTASPRPSWRATALAVLLLLAVGAVLVAPTLRGCLRCWSELYDWRYFQAMEQVFRTSVVEYGQVPLWNPYACGGEVGVANPQSTALAPTFLLSLVLGTALGVKAALFVYLLCALVGAYALARALGASVAGALVTGVSYGGSGWFAMHLATGHINFAGAALYPLLLLCYLKTVGERGRGDGGAWIFVLPGGALIAWMAALGGTYTVPMGVVLLGTLAITDAARRRSWRPVGMVAAIGLVALLVGAARFLPLLEFVTDHPRHVGEKDGNDAFDVARMFLAWRQKLEPVSGGHEYWWHEYCCHLSYLALALALFAALQHAPSLRIGRRWIPVVVFAVWTCLVVTMPGLDRSFGPEVPPVRYAARVIGAPLLRDAYHLLGVVLVVLATRRTAVFRFVPLVIVGLGIVAGTAWPHGPWWLIRHLPLYRDLRVPARYLIIVALVASLLSAHGLDAVRAWLAARRGERVARAVAIAAVAVVVGETVAFNWPAYSDSRFVLRVTPPSPPPPFIQVESDWRSMLSGILTGHGVLKCDEEAPLQRGELDSGDVEQVRLVDPSAGSVRQLEWSPNALRLQVELTRPTDVLINQNWNEHWKAADQSGAPVEVKSVAGRLAVRPQATGRTQVVVRYRPRSFVIGAWLSGLSLPAAALIFLAGWWRRRRRPAAPPSAPTSPPEMPSPPPGPLEIAPPAALPSTDA